MELIRCCVTKHPYLSVIFLWTALFCIFGNFGTEYNVIFNYVSAVIFTAGIIPLNELYIHFSGKKSKQKKNYLFLIISAVYMTLVVFLYLSAAKNKLGWGRNSAVIFAAGIIPIAVAFACIKIKKKSSFKRLFLLLILAGFFLHFFYTVYIEFENQHDLNFYTSPDESGIAIGHMGYIRYIYENFLPLQSDPRPYWQFYHPPLHYFLEAGFLHLQTLFGTDIETAVLNIKYPPLLYYMLTTVTLVKIMRMLKIDGIPLLTSTAIILFSPGLIMVSNYANNDMLSVFLMVHSVYLAMLWFKDRKTVNIIKTALVFGLGMFAKLSAWMAAVPIAVIFISALIPPLKEKKFKTFTRSIGQMCVFLLIAAPLSFYWSIRNYIRFGIPVSYIPTIESTYQHIDVPVVQRLFDFNFSQFKSPYVNIAIISDYNEYNPMIALLKSASVNVLKPEKSYNQLFMLPNNLCLWAGIIIAAAAFICMVYILIKKNNLSITAKTAIILSYITVLISYYIFCIKYPEVCTENIRYASQLIFIGALSVGAAIKYLGENKSERSKIIQRTLKYITLFFCITSALLFSIDGLWTSLYYNFL